MTSASPTSSCYTHGLMGYQTPNIDRVAREGMMFTDSYGEQSCTAGRSSFITGQSVYRTGLSKVGIPASPIGMPDSAITIAGALKNQGYATGQFGKNHLGDLNRHLPTVHGFDEFFGNLYHLNAEEEPEMANYPSEKDFPNFRKTFGPRGVHSLVGQRQRRRHRAAALGPRRQAEDRRHRAVDQEAHGNLRRRVRRRRQGFHQAPGRGRHAVLRLGQHHPHAPVHAHEEGKPRPGRSLAIALSRHHDRPRQATSASCSTLLDELGIAENTFVMYSTDNGPHMNSWPDGGMTPFRSEKNTNWEGAFRVPLMVRWPGKIKAAPLTRSGENFLVIINDILDVWKIESGKLTLETIGFRLDDVVL